MRCPYCRGATKVVDSRVTDENSIRRRRECLKCDRRFTTYEQIEPKPMYVVKKDGSREKFDREKLKRGIMKACERRPIPIQVLEKQIEGIERQIQDKREIKSSVIGELVMERLRKLDEVAYIRFASVYRSFADLTSFEDELRKLVRERE